MAAEQAAKISDKNIIVIPSKSIPQCVSALMAFSSEKTPEENEKKMTSALSKVKTAQITYAVRDTEIEGHKIKEGDILGINEGKIDSVANDAKAACMEIMDKMLDDDSEYVTFYYGEDVDDAAAQALCDELEEKYPDVEFAAKKGGQSLYYYIISVE